eukprot:364791-Chlamydomonas_euryale.AAC.12
MLNSSSIVPRPPGRKIYAVRSLICGAGNIGEFLCAYQHVNRTSLIGRVNRTSLATSLRDGVNAQCSDLSHADCNSSRGPP